METWIIQNNKTPCCSEKMANSESPSAAQRALCGCGLALAQCLRVSGLAAEQLGGPPGDCPGVLDWRKAEHFQKKKPSQEKLS